MNKLVIALAAAGVLAVGGGAYALNQSEPAQAATANAGQVSNLVISADDNNGIKVTVTGGPEGKREVTVSAGQKETLPSTGGHEYTLEATSDTGDDIGEATVPGGEQGGWDCFANDDYGKLMFGCVIGVG
jgi:hypothetical protein